MIARMKSAKSTRRFRHFTMIELVIALVVIIVAVLSIMVLLPKGLDANRHSMSRSTAMTAVQQFLRYSQNRLRGDWIYSHAFPIDQKPFAENDPLHMQWSTKSLSPSEYLEILWFVNEGSADADFDPAIHNSGLFKVLHRSSAGSIDFSAMIRAWREVKDFGDGSEIAAKQVVINAEISWPAEMPYLRRQKDVFQITMFHPGEVSALIVNVLADSIFESDGPNATSATVTRVFGPLDVAISVDLSTSNATKAVPSVPSVIIPAGELSATFGIDAIDNDILDGTHRVTITATASDPNSPYSPGSDAIDVLDDESMMLRVAIAKDSIPENGGSSPATVSRLGGNLGQALPVSLFTSDQLKAVPSPTLVLIGPNQSSASFMVYAVDDTILGGTKTVRISASATGYVGHYDSINVTDHETLSIALNRQKVNESDGQNAAVGTVTRSNTDVHLPITVLLSSSDNTTVAVPTSVEIPAGSQSATFSIDTIPDDALNPTVTITITASNEHYISGTAQLIVEDNALLVLALSATHISENAGPGAVVGTVIRQVGNPDDALLVNLSSSDSTEATVPNTVTIPIGRVSATFPINAIDDAILDGDQLVTIRAQSAGFVPATALLTVTDHEYLTVSVPVDAVWENADNPAATGSVSRSNTDPADPAFGQPLVVVLTSGDTSRITLPATVSIPAGQATINFPISVVNDGIVTGDMQVTIIASANGYVEGTDNILVKDTDFAVTLADNFLFESAAAGRTTTTGTVTRGSAGIAIAVHVTSSDITEAQVDISPIYFGVNDLTAEFSITAVDDDLLDGNQTVVITATADGFNGGSTTLIVADDEIGIAIAPDRIRENQGDAAAVATIIRGNPVGTLTVNLSSSDTTEATVAEPQIVFADGQSSRTVAINAQNDDILDGNQVVTITAVAETGKSVTQNIEVIDTNLQLTLASNEIGEDESTQGTISRGNAQEPLTVTLASSDLTEATVAPLQVTLAAGVSTATFTIHGVNDGIEDGDQLVSITASAANHDSAEANLTVRDLGNPAITLTIAPDRISEDAGENAGVITVRRNSDTTLALLVTLNSSDTSEATVPVNVTIPAGHASTTAPIHAVDDDYADGDQLVTITATAPLHDNGTATVTILDNEVATLTLVISPDSIREDAGNNAAVGTVTRNSDTTNALTISLSSSDTTEVTVANQVTIPAGSNSTTFGINAIDDNIEDGDQTATVTASANDHVSASYEVTIVDVYNYLKLVIAPTSFTRSAGDEAAVGTVTRYSLDIDDALSVTLASSDTTSATGPATVQIAAGESTATFHVAAVPVGGGGGQAMGVESIAPEADTDATRSSLSAGNGGAQTMAIPNNHDVTVTFTANAALFNAATAQVSVTYSQLLLTVTPNTFASDAGEEAAIGRVTRGGGGYSDALYVALSSSDSDAASVPTSVTIAAGSQTASFYVAAGEGGSGSGYGGSVSATLNINPNNSPHSEFIMTTAAGVAYTRDHLHNQAPIGTDGTFYDGQATYLRLRPKGSGTQNQLIINGEAFTVRNNRNYEFSGNITARVYNDHPHNGKAMGHWWVALSGDNIVVLEDGEPVVECGDIGVTISASASAHLSATAAITVTCPTGDPSALSLAIAPNVFEDTAGDEAAVATVSRNNGTSGSLVVTLTSSETNSVTVPASVTIQDGASSATFHLAAVVGGGNREGGGEGGNLIAGGANINPNNSPHNEFTVVTGQGTYTRDHLHKNSPIGADGVFYQGEASYVRLKPKGNGNQNSLYLNGAVFPLHNGSTYEFSGDLTVRVWNAKPKNGKAMGHWWIDMDGNGIAVTDDGDSVGETTAEGECVPVRVAISATASYYSPAVESVTVTCGTQGALALSANPTSFPATAGNEASVGTVSRDSDTTANLVINLASSDSNVATVPQNVTIPAGESSATFNIAAVDDGDNATSSSTISATAAGHSSASVEVNIVESYFASGIFVEKKIVLTGSSQIVGTAVTNATNANAVDFQWSAIITGDLFIGPGGVPNTVIKSPRPNKTDNVGGDVLNLPELRSYVLPPFPQFPAGPAKSDIKITGGANNDRTLNPEDYDGCRFNEIEIRSNRKLTINLGGANRTIRVGTLDIQQGHIVLQGGGSLTFYVENSITLGGDSTINNSGSPEAAHIYYAGNTTINPGGNTRYRGSLYAQNANINIPGSSGIMGHIITGGDNVSITGDASALVRVLYAPLAKVLLTGSGKLRGGLVCQELEGQGNIRVFHDTSYGEPVRDLPGQ